MRFAAFVCGGLMCGAITVNAATIATRIGAGAPPATLAHYQLLPYSADTSPLHTDVSGVTGPCGQTAFSPPLNHRRVGQGWPSWSHGYRGDIYYSNGATTVTLRLPQGVRAFIFYVQPETLGTHTITATTPDGTRLTQDVTADAGAAGFGFHVLGRVSALSSMTIQAEVPFAIGEFLSVNCRDCRPTILTQPGYQMAQVGGAALFSVDATPAPLQYQWYRNGNPIAGETLSSLIINPVSPGDAGTYSVRVSNSCGGVQSQGALLEVYRDLPPIVCPGMYVPEAWLATPVPWLRDRDGNKIDDLLDADPPEKDARIIVNFRVEPDDGHRTLLSAFGQIAHACRYISTIFVAGADYAGIMAIAAHPDVAFVEFDLDGDYLLDVSVPAIRVASDGGAPDTVEEVYPGITGVGSNLAIIDSGADDPGGPGTPHGGFAAAVYGFDGISDTEINPEDIRGHGTHVASIALGAGINPIARGVAPAAGLIDMKNGVINPVGISSVRCLEKVIERRTDWNICAVNLSFKLGAEDNGIGAFCQLVDRTVGLGVTVIAAAGNDGASMIAGLEAPASASRAVTVAAAAHQDTITRTDDVIADFSSFGPRDADGDSDCRDELKPDVTAHGTNIPGPSCGGPDAFFNCNDCSGGITAACQNNPNTPLTAPGTSMAAPHVTGLVGLIRQARPGINPASVKEILIRTAEQFGPASDPSCDPAWNSHWGYGLVNGYAAIDALMAAATSDLTFDSDPPPISWLSPDIIVHQFGGPVSVIQAGIAADVEALVENRSGATATNVRVEFGVYIFSTINPTFYHLGTIIIPILPATSTPVSVTLTGWIPTSDTHQCMKVEIGYGLDDNPLNNIAQRNLNVTSSPVRFRVENLVRCDPTPAQIRFEVRNQTPGSRWTTQLTPPELLLAGGAAAHVTALPVPPLDLPDGAEELIHVGSFAGQQLLGGVSILAIKEDCNGNGHDDYFDIRDGRSRDADLDGIPDECACGAAFTSLRPAALGDARYHCTTRGRLRVLHIGGGGNNGVALQTGPVEAGRIDLEELVGCEQSFQPGATLELRGLSRGQAHAMLRLIDQCDELELSAGFAGTGTFAQIHVYRGGALIAREIAPLNGHSVGRWPIAVKAGRFGDAPDVSAFFAAPTTIRIRGRREVTVAGDEVRIVSLQPGAAPLYDRLELRGRNVLTLTLTGFRPTPLRHAGDLNCDARVTFDDLDGFVTALVSRTAYEALMPGCNYDNGDTNDDGAVDFGDIENFIALLIGA